MIRDQSTLRFIVRVGPIKMATSLSQRITTNWIYFNQTIQLFFVYIVISAAEFRKYCKRLHVDMYMKRKRLHTKYSIVNVVYLPFDKVIMCGVWRRWEKKQWAIIWLFSEYFHFLSKQVILRLIKLIRNTLVLFYYMSKSLGYQLCLNLTPSQKNLWSPLTCRQAMISRA